MSKSLFVFVKRKQHIFVLAGYLLAMVATALSPLLFMTGEASASGQLTQRSLTLSTAQASATNVSYTFTFNNVSTTAIKGLKFIACTTATSTYGGGNTCAGSGAAPTGMSFSAGPAAFVSQTGFADNGISFARDATGGNYCTPAANVLCASRAGNSTAETTNTTHTITFSGIVNSSTTNTPFYIGIYTYDATTNASALDGGTVASAIVSSLTVNARVAEILNFCIGATAVDDTTTDPTNSGNHDCSVVSGTSVNIGTLDSGTVNISPVTTNGGDSNNAIAMVRSNAANGVNVYYRAIQASTGTNHLGSLRVTGASCNAGTVNTDGCINSIGTTQATITAGTEDFGMTIAGINHGSTTSYSCVYASPGGGDTCDLVPQNNYVGQGTTGTLSTYTYGNSNGFAWDESGTSVLIASSTSSTIPQVDDEAMILKFGATSNIITPFGAYSVQSDFIAVPTF